MGMLFQVMSCQSEATQKLLMFTPHKFRQGTYILQTWMRRFHAPSCLKVPTWFALKNIPRKFLGVAARWQEA